MARKSKIEGKKLIELFDVYINQQLDGNIENVSIPAFGNYLRSEGYDIADYIIRRNEEFREYLNLRKNETKEKHFSIVFVYMDLDIERFLQKNNTREKLVRALSARDNYYRSISNSAADCFKQYKEMKEKQEQLQKKASRAEEANIQLSEEAAKLRKEKAKLEEELTAMKDILSTYVYPEIANELLAQAGIVINTPKIADVSAIESNLITAETDMSSIKNKTVRSLLKGFNEND